MYSLKTDIGSAFLFLTSGIPIPFKSITSKIPSLISNNFTFNFFANCWTNSDFPIPDGPSK